MLFKKTIFAGLVLLVMEPKRAKPQATNMCRRVNEGRLRMRILTGHVISTQTAHGFEECADLCANNPSCYSVNYYGRQTKCELNDKTSFNHPEHMTWLGDGSYLDIHRPYSDCSDLFCDLHQVCKMDRVDHTYCRVCDLPLGMESGAIADSQVNASSTVEGDPYQPASARLHNQGGHWVPNNDTSGEWLQIDFIERVAVTKVATQGRSLVEYQGQQHWVKSYKLSFSKDAVSWEFFKENGQEKMFPGNFDNNTVVFHALSPKIRHTRYVRFVVITWHTRINLRVEVYGCKE